MSGGEQYVGGIEGGATKTTIVILKTDGTVLAEEEGPSSNHWLIGLEECARRIDKLVADAKRKANLDMDTPLQALGLSMSGGDSEEARANINKAISSHNKNISLNYVVCCDTQGAVATACESGGIVLIAGTGSNCEVVNSDGSRHRVGGWGHAIGDEGSGYWITHYCLKKMFDDMDNIDPSPHDMTYIKDTWSQHFGVKDRMAFLEQLYPHPNKSHFAAMATKIAEGATKFNNGLCKEAFHRGGFMLGRHILAVAPKIDKDLFTRPGGLHVVCVGSVWKSWDLLKEGFLEGLRPRNDKDVTIRELTLTTLEKAGHFGAAYLGARGAGLRIDVDYAANASVFYHHKE